MLQWNPAAETVFGWREDEVIGQMLPILPAAAHDEFQRLRDEVWGGKALTGFETIRQRKDGSEITVRISAAPFRDDRGIVVGVLCMLEDLSVRRSLERSVAETRHLLDSLVNASTVAVIVTDVDARIRMWNPAAEQMYGWSAAEVVGQFLDAIGTTTAARLLKAVLAGEPIPDAPAIVWERRRDGSEFESWPIVAVVRSGATPVGAMVLVRDVTVQVAAERAVQEANEQLRALSQRMVGVLEEERARISREVHDELGQLLTATTFDLAALRTKTPEPERAAKLDQMIGRLGEAVGAMRRITANLRPPLLDTLGLEAAIREEVAAFQERFGIEADLSLPLRPTRCRGEVALAVYRIVQEALTNVARHAMAERVDIRLRQRDGLLYVEIRDDGKGIGVLPPRAGALGLLGMRERAASVGGTLRVEPGESRGTMVTLVVPAGEGEG